MNEHLKVVDQVEVAARLVRARKKIGLRQVDVSKLSGKVQAVVSQWEAGQIPAGAVEITALGCLLGVRPDDLYLASPGSSQRARYRRLLEDGELTPTDEADAMAFLDTLAKLSKLLPGVAALYRDQAAGLHRAFLARLEGRAPESPEYEPLPLTGEEVAALRQDLLAFQVGIPAGSDGAKRARAVKHWLDRLSVAQPPATPTDTAPPSPAPGESRASGGAAPGDRPLDRKTPGSRPSSSPRKKKR